jgi:SsrA-binding protein
MRKLLLSRQELDKLLKKTKIKGFTIVPTRLFIGKNGYAKLEIALAEGKKLYDKRESLKQADDKRSMDRTMKNYR